jgi:hypothetical protein
MLTLSLALALLAAPTQTASDRAWARVSRIHAQVHALTHRVHEVLPRDASWTAEDDCAASTLRTLQLDLAKLSVDVSVAVTRRPSPPEATRLRLVGVLCSALTAQCELLWTATLDKPDARWRSLLPPACAFTESILQEWRETEYSR